MEEFADWVSILYKERRIYFEKQWPPRSGTKLVELHLVESDAYVREQEGGKTDSHRSMKMSQKDREQVKYTRIKCSELFESKPGERKIKRVLLEGHAGIGKTTFCLDLTVEWSNKELFKQFKLVLFLSLRDHAVATAKCLSDVVKRLKKYDVNLCESVIKELDRNAGDNVLIVADGWDELSESHRSEGNFLYDLLVECSVLPRASVLLTSRPSASAPFHKFQCFDRFVQVVGFDHGNIVEYFQSELTPERASLLGQQLDHNPLIESICAIPLNCAIVCHLFNELGEVLPTTMTELYTKMILLIVARNIDKKFNAGKTYPNFNDLPKQLHASWWLLCEFAFWGIERDKVVFSHDEVKRFFPEGTTSVDESLGCFGLLQSFEALLSGGVEKGVSLDFLHSTVQEYLAALHLAKLSPDKQLVVFRSFARFDQFIMVWRFYFGISCNFVKIYGIKSDKQLSTPNPTVKEIADSEVKAFLVDRIKYSILHRREYRNIFLCHCSFESNDNYVKALVIQALRRAIRTLVCKATTAHDCAAFIDLFHSFQTCTSLSIYFNGCSLGNGGVAPLADVLAKNSVNLQVTQMHLAGNNITDAGVKTIFSINHSAALKPLRTVYLYDNQITEVGVKSITIFLSLGGTNNLSRLSLSNNPLGISGIQALEDGIDSGTLNNLEFLYLAATLSSDPVINGALLTSLLESIATNCNELRCLDLSNNHLGVPGAQAVGTVCSKITGDLLFSYTSSGSGFRLYLDKTNLGDEGVIAFIHSLNGPCCFGKLAISGNELRNNAILAVSESVNSGNLQVIELVLDDNPLELGALNVLSMLSNETSEEIDVYLRCCNFPENAFIGTTTASLVEVPLADRGFQNSSIHSIYLDDSSLTGPHIGILALFMAKCIQLEVLSCVRCCITSDDLAILFSQLSKTTSTLNRLTVWNLDENKIDDSGVQLLSQHASIFFTKNSYSNGSRLERSRDIEISLGDNHGLSMESNATQQFYDTLKSYNMHARKLLKEKSRRERLKSFMFSESKQSIHFSEQKQMSNYLNKDLLRNALLILVYFDLWFEAVYLISPGYPHNPPTITLDVVDKEDETTRSDCIDITLPLLKHVFSPGLRVVRGRDWDIGNYDDGGEGHVGTVVKISEPLPGGGRNALVQWDCGNSGQYKCGVEGKFALRVIDSSPTAYLLGMGWQCPQTSLENQPFRFRRRKQNLQVHICTGCYMADVQTGFKDSFVRYDEQRHSSLFSVQVPPRTGARKLKAKGIFPGAVVVRGPDWNHGDDDGGDVGIVEEMADWKGKIYYGSIALDRRNAVQVKWNATKKSTKCRLGYQGKVDVKCVTPSFGGYYYVDHLPMLGAPYSVQQAQADRVRQEQLKNNESGNTVMTSKPVEQPSCPSLPSRLSGADSIDPSSISSPLASVDDGQPASKEDHHVNQKYIPVNTKHIEGHSPHMQILTADDIPPPKIFLNQQQEGSLLSTPVAHAEIPQTSTKETLSIVCDFKPATFSRRDVDPSAYEQWELKKISDKLNGEGIVIAIIDNGVNCNHVAFQTVVSEKRLMGLNFVPGKDRTAWTKPGGQKLHHGTMATFIAGGEAFGQVRSGVAPKSTLLFCSVGDSYSRQAIIDALNALITMIENGFTVDIISMSFGLEYQESYDESQATVTHLIYKLKHKHKVVLIGSSGNYGDIKGVLFPARLDEVICVGAHNTAGKESKETPSKDINVYAPGEDIDHASAYFDDLRGCYTVNEVQRSTGSSCATPAIAGLMALVLEFSKKYVTGDQERSKYRENLVFLKTVLFKEMTEGNPFLLKPVKFFDPNIKEHKLKKVEQENKELKEALAKAHKDGVHDQAPHSDQQIQANEQEPDCDSLKCIEVKSNEDFTKDFETFDDISDKVVSATTYWELDRVHPILNGSGIVIAILDSGIDSDHMAFKKRCKKNFIQGQNYLSSKPENSWKITSDSHGSMMAFVAGGTGFEAKFLQKTVCNDPIIQQPTVPLKDSRSIPSGIAPGAQLHICRVSETDVLTKAVTDALTWILERNKQDLRNNEPLAIDVICMSFPLKQDDLNEEQCRQIKDLFKDLTQQGVICVTNARNKSVFSDIDDVIFVGALTKDGLIAETNPVDTTSVDVYAPAENIPAPLIGTSNGVQYFKGCSCAVPAIAGLIALILQLERVKHKLDTDKYPGVKNVLEKKLNDPKYLKHTVLKRDMLMNQGDPGILHPLKYFTDICGLTL